MDVMGSDPLEKNKPIQPWEVANVAKARGRRESPVRHPLAALRAEIGLSQDQMAELLGVSRKTVQAVELGNLKLSDSLANRIVKETWISPDWLMGGDLTKPMVSCHDAPFDRGTFELAQAWKTATAEEAEKEAKERQVLNSIAQLLFLMRDRGLVVERARALNDLWAINNRLVEAFDRDTDELERELNEHKPS